LFDNIRRRVTGFKLGDFPAYFLALALDVLQCFDAG
jgi:hypothetical protein